MTDRAYNAQKKRIVCWFSCGAASAVATKLALSQFANQEVVIARCIVREEHPDNDRFAADCEKWFGVQITNLINEKYDGSIYNVFTARKYISGVSGAPCTFELKKRVREEFELPTDRHIFGYCHDEQSRFDRFLDANNIDAIAPLIDRGLSHSDCLAIVERAGIRLPEMYRLGYKHNNCVGCCKSTGAGYWNKIRKDFPEMFDRMAQTSERFGVKLVRVKGERVSLKDLPPDIGDYSDEPEIQCGIFCEMANNEIKENT